MPFLRVRALSIRAQTPGGVFAFDMEVPDGLVVLRGENSSGKTTVVNAILYGLGLEGMLSPGGRPPFADVLTTRLLDGDQPFPVVGSEVILRIEGSERRQCILRRTVAGRDANASTLVSVTLCSPAGAPEGGTRDYYVRIPGAAREEAGFHRFLAGFMGLALPEVPRRQGGRSLLYLECIFPIMFVDQLTGWRPVHTRLPTHYGIPDVWQRVIEFVLDLDARRVRQRKQELDIAESAVLQRWKAVVSSAMSRLQAWSALLSGVSLEIPPVWPSIPSPTVLVEERGAWVPVEQALTAARAKFDRLESQKIPKISEALHALRRQQEETERRLNGEERDLAEAQSRMLADEAHLRAVRGRIDALADDLRKFKDEIKLRKRGSILPAVTGPRPDGCPTCGQSTGGVLTATPVVAMSADESVVFIEGQLKLFRNMEATAARAVTAAHNMAMAKGEVVEQLRSMLRAVKTSLREDGEAPSVAAVRERLLLEDRIAKLTELLAFLDSFIGTLAPMHDEWVKLREARAAIGDEDESKVDAQKRYRLQAAMREQLRLYGFRSTLINEIEISAETLRPTRDGYDVVGTSASDSIRCVWAYLVGLLAVTSGYEDAAHLGLLVMDEPQQQRIDDLSFEQLLRYSGEVCASSGRQLIFASSEKAASLLSMLDGVAATVIEIPAQALQRVVDSDIAS